MEERKYEGHNIEEIVSSILDRKQGDINDTVAKITETMKEKETEEKTH